MKRKLARLVLAALLLPVFAFTCAEVEIPGGIPLWRPIFQISAATDVGIPGGTPLWRTVFQTSAAAEAEAPVSLADALTRLTEARDALNAEDAARFGDAAGAMYGEIRSGVSELLDGAVAAIEAKMAAAPQEDASYAAFIAYYYTRLYGVSDESAVSNALVGVAQTTPDPIAAVEAARAAYIAAYGDAAGIPDLLGDVENLALIFRARQFIDPVAEDAYRFALDACRAAVLRGALRTGMIVAARDAAKAVLDGAVFAALAGDENSSGGEYSIALGALHDAVMDSAAQAAYAFASGSNLVPRTDMKVRFVEPGYIHVRDDAGLILLGGDEGETVVIARESGVFSVYMGNVRKVKASGEATLVVIGGAYDYITSANRATVCVLMSDAVRVTCGGKGSLIAGSSARAQQIFLDNTARLFIDNSVRADSVFVRQNARVYKDGDMPLSVTEGYR